MSRSNNIPVWGAGNDLLNSGISISSLGGGFVCKTGTTNRLDASATGETTVITHGLGKTPVTLEFYSTHQGSDISACYGIYDGTNNIFNNSCYGSTQTIVDLGTGVIKCNTWGNSMWNSQLGTITANNSTTFTITWTRIGTYNAGNYTYIIWKASG